MSDAALRGAPVGAAASEARSETTSEGRWRVIADVPVDVERGRVFEHGWQSWSPTAIYPVGVTSHRPQVPYMATMCWRPDRAPPQRGFQGEGLLAVDPGNGDPVRVFAATDGLEDVPSIRAEMRDVRLVISHDGNHGAIEDLVAEPSPGSLTAPTGTRSVGTATIDGSDGQASASRIRAALADWADGFAHRAGAAATPLRPAPTAWCSWYAYFAQVTQADIEENLTAIERYELPVDIVQIDDGWQAGIGDWLAASPRFGSLPDVMARIRGGGRRVGLWLAPFLVAANSELARDHPDWLVGGADAGRNWNQQLTALDVTHPGAAGYLTEACTRLRAAGVDYLKLDFLYAGALAGRRHRAVPPLVAYRQGLELIADAAGPDTFLLGSGAPILPSVGLVDAMRVAPDIDVTVEPIQGDLSRPSLRAAALTVQARAWQHGRFWVNDPDCLLARPAMPQRQRWANLVERYGGLRASGDRIADLDAWGLDTTCRLLSAVPPPTPWPDAEG